ncbi:MAG: phospholipase D-like domain-containing protein [Lactimicrobium sp.]|jgi:cardiolipin synthase|uniref:phospholipase D-like domain-containing protein n=1 Tax=Lactimicrobium sp. TaxID=2563780 RepID=UPI002F34F44F
MWDGMMAILKEKAAQGLDVRVMYDDMGSLATLPASYAKQLEQDGIKCVRFNKLNPIIGAVMNHRDHRKIMVIDGTAAFSGGINLADEYINQKVKHGHWKDNCIRIKGEAVWSYTVMFLTNWNALRPTDEDFTIFKAENKPAETDGYICAYGDSPFDNESTGQNVYVNILNHAKKYVYISTPYLIIDTDMENALILAAKRGVDVRILAPGVPDKKMVWYLTRSFYQNLIEGGVKIYEYTPGFNHAKIFVSDDETATVGTINLDYRSLYLHFENGTYLCGSRKVMDIKDDMLQTFAVSHQMQKGEIKENVFQKMAIGFVKLFASQM